MVNLLRKITLLTTILGVLQGCGVFKPKVKPEEVMPTPPIEIVEKPMPKGKTDAWLNDILQKNADLAAILNNPGTYNTQIIYTQINRDADNKPSFTTYLHNSDPNFYFYPASVVKMPIAFLALQKINELNQKGIAITKDMTMITESSSAMQSSVYNDPTTADGRPTIANYIKKIFLVSDNDAFNRLYEFLGQEYTNSTLQRMGYKDAEILHRLSISLSEEENRKTNPIKFYDSTGTLLYEQAEQMNKRKYSKRNDKRGVGYIKGGKKIDAPFDFSTKNRLSLKDMHELLTAVIFSNATDRKKTFTLTDVDRSFLLQYMSMLPTQSTYPSYKAPDYWDTYLKFNLLGSEKKPMPKNLRIFNKSGEAYGYLTDVCYIIDVEKNIEFLLSATIYVNQDEVFNDDQYGYETVGFPFLKKLGEQLYNYELQRNKKHTPNLTEFYLP
jgi:hypothetical protein